MKRTGWIALILLGIGIVSAAALYIRGQRRDRRAEAAREERAERRLEQARVERENLRRQSANAMPAMLGDVALGLSLEDLREARPQIESSPQSGNDDSELSAYAEELENGARVVYLFRAGALARVQVMSLLPSIEAIAPHLSAMNDRYGVPNGVFTCPNTGGVPTRRFTWSSGPVGISDIFLLYGDRVSVTLYITSAEETGQSLREGACRPTPRDEVAAFPQADPAQLRQ